MKSDLKLQASKPYFEQIRSLPALRVSKNLLIVLLLFWTCILCTVYLEQITAWILGYSLKAAAIDLTKETDLSLLLQLALTLISIALTFVCCRFIENRPCRTMYLTRRKCLPDYLTGALLGFAMMSAVVLIAWRSGAIRCEGTQMHGNPWMVFLLFLMWMVQGFSEELTFRGWLMTSVGTHHAAWLAALISAVCFALLHMGNDGFSLFAVFNLILFSIVTAIYVLRTGSLWGVAALHGVWNWAQGNFYGMQVSGIKTGSTVLRFTQSGSAEWIGGGVFGLEGGAAASIVLIAAAVILLLMPSRKYNTEE